MRDIELASTSPDIEWERYQLVNTDALQIFARNKNRTPALQTFSITLVMSFSQEEKEGFAQLTLLLIMILLCCLCTACCLVLLRLKCKINRRSVRDDRMNDQDIERIEAGIDAETHARNQRMAQLRQQQQ